MNTALQAYKEKRILVTGADGFIGSHLVQRLTALGARVIVSKKETTNLTIPGSAERLIAESKPELIFNAASIVDTTRSFEGSDRIIASTYDLARQVIDAAVRNDVRRVVQFGTIEEYGMNPAPFVETMREDPISPYSLGKTMATHYALTVARLTALETVVVRPGTTFGPRQSARMLVPLLMQSGVARKDFDMNLGEQKRDFIYVVDLVSGILVAGAQEGISGEIFNLGSNRGRMVREIAETVNEVLGNPIHINFGAQSYRPLDSMVFYMDSTKAKNVLGWEATTDFKDAMRETAAWYREHVSTSS